MGDDGGGDEGSRPVIRALFGDDILEICPGFPYGNKMECFRGVHTEPGLDIGIMIMGPFVGRRRRMMKQNYFYLFVAAVAFIEVVIFWLSVDMLTLYLLC